MPAQAMENLQSLASKVSLDNEVTDLQAFVGQYLDVVQPRLPLRLHRSSCDDLRINGDLPH